MVEPNYSLKSKAISEGYHLIEKELSKVKYQKLMKADYYLRLNDIERYNQAIDEWDVAQSNYDIFLSNPLFVEAIKINHASYTRKRRLQDRIYEMLLTNKAYFLTLTFSDDTLANTTDDTRKRYVKRFLKANCSNYVANVDYGKENGREHYHAVVVSDSLDMSSWDKYGFSKADKVRNESDSCKLAKYVCKLTNHAIKETCRRQAVIYCRTKR